MQKEATMKRTSIQFVGSKSEQEKYQGCSSVHIELEGRRQHMPDNSGYFKFVPTTAFGLLCVRRFLQCEMIECIHQSVTQLFKTFKAASSLNA